jgi:hypothetical protein
MTQNCSVFSRRLASCSGVASGASISMKRRIAPNPTGTSRDTPSVPRRSRSPSAVALTRVSGMPSAVATIWQVICAHAAKAARSRSPEQLAVPGPPTPGVSFADDRSTGRLDHAPQRTVLLTGHCSQGDERLLRPFAVALLERSLQSAQIQHVLFLSLHWRVALAERSSLVNRNVYRIGRRAGSVEPIEGDTCQRDV